MSFRKRGVVLPQSGSGAESSGSSPLPSAAAKEQAKGTRPSPLTGTPTTSTGTSSLDSLFGGHSGLVLGSSLLIEEQGTTDFGGAVLRYYAAEGVVQGHTVHVLGVGEAWGRELPGLSEEKQKKEVAKVDGIGREREERMKIAWRYERLGEFGTSGRGAWSLFDFVHINNTCSPDLYAQKLTIPSHRENNHIDILPYLRPFQTPHPPLSLKHPLHAPFDTTRPIIQTHRPLGVTIHEIPDASPNTARLILANDDPPNNHPLPPKSSTLPFARLLPRTHPTIPAQPPRTPTCTPHYNISADNIPPLPLPSLNRTYALDRVAV